MTNVKSYTTADLAKFAIHLLDPQKCRAQCLAFLQTKSEDTPEYSERILSEYARLFMGIGSSQNSLRASVWLNPPGYMYPTTVSEIQSFYRQSQLTLQATTRDADHLGLMLIFISLLLDHREYSFARVFYNNYIRPWLPRLIQQIRRADSLFYAPLLKILNRELNQLFA